MKAKKMITKIISALLIMVLVATCAPVTGFAADGNDAVSKITYIANTAAGVKISFTAVDGASKYNIYRQTEDEAFEEIASTASTSFIDKSVENGVMYTYYAEPNTDEGANAVPSEISKSILFVETPAFTVENTDIGPVVKITPVEGATSYEIKRCDKGSSSYLKIGTVDPMSDLYFTDITAEDGESYKYSVVAIMYSGHSYYYSASLVAELAEVMTEDNATDITYIANKKEGVKLTFKEVDAESYTLYRMSDTETYKPVVVTADAKYVDTAVESGVLYTYKVAVTGYYYSDNARSIMFLDTPAFSVANAGTGVKVDFEAVKGAKYYEIKRHDDTTSVFTKIGTVSADQALTFFDKTVENGKTYTYSVVAVNGKYFSYYNTKKITTFLTSPVTLTNVTGGVKVVYSKVDDATRYTIFRRTDSTGWEAITSFKPASYFNYIDKTAVSGVEYYYSIQAETADNCTGYDPEGVKIMYLESPTLFLSNDADSITIDFTATPGAVSYNILKKLPSSGSYKVIGKVSASDALTFVDTDVKEGETYSYGVRAVNGKYTSYFKTKSIENAVITMDDAVTDTISTVISSITGTDAAAAATTAAATNTAADATGIVNTITDAANRLTGILKIFQAIINVLLFIPNTIKAFSTIANIFSLIF